MIWSGALTLCVRWRKCVDNGCVSSINAVYRRLRVLPWQQSMFGAAHKISASQWKIYSDCANRRREQREHTHRSYIATVTQINTVTDSDLDVWVFTACNVTTLFSTEYLFGHFTAGVGKNIFHFKKLRLKYVCEVEKISFESLFQFGVEKIELRQHFFLLLKCNLPHRLWWISHCVVRLVLSQQIRIC